MLIFNYFIAYVRRIVSSINIVALVFKKEINWLKNKNIYW